MVRGPTLLGTAYRGASEVRGIFLVPLNMVTVYVWLRLKPAAPGPDSEVMAGGTINVPGGTGLGEFPGASIPAPAPAKPVNSVGSLIVVLNWMLKVISETASLLLS